jgi:Mor family transcriptional regulator
LSNEMVREIRAEHAAHGTTCRELGLRYDVSNPHINRIIRRIAYRNVE